MIRCTLDCKVGDFEGELYKNVNYSYLSQFNPFPPISYSEITTEVQLL